MVYVLVAASCCRFDYVCLIESSPRNEQSYDSLDSFTFTLLAEIRAHSWRNIIGSQLNKPSRRTFLWWQGWPSGESTCLPPM